MPWRRGTASRWLGTRLLEAGLAHAVEVPIRGWTPPAQFHWMFRSASSRPISADQEFDFSRFFLKASPLSSRNAQKAGFTSGPWHVRSRYERQAQFSLSLAAAGSHWLPTHSSVYPPPRARFTLGAKSFGLAGQPWSTSLVDVIRVTVKSSCMMWSCAMRVAHSA